MKGIYLTEEGKKAIEDEIAELEEDLKEASNPLICIDISAELNTYKRILCYATILPVEKNWDGVFDKTFSQAYIEKDYPDGVIIIKSKQ
jgi:hypothetical protein